MFKKLGVVALSGALVFSGLSLGAADAAKPDNPGKGKGNGNNGKVENVIYMIPDGFSPDYAANYRVYKGEEAIWDKHLKGMYTTHSANSDITDSAAAGTAMATGNKTNNGVIGLDPEGNELETILEAAEKDGRSSGLVATSTITHATPASFAAHVVDRNNETEIARQLVTSDVDVMLGGGKNNFLSASQDGNQEELNLIKQAEDQGFEFVETRDELTDIEELDVENGDRLLGLFADDALSPELHRGDTAEPSIAEMTKTAIDVLEEDKDGFFLVVEGSQIDWAGHDNDAAWAMSDTAAFEKAVEEAIEFAKEDGKTLVVVAGDHDTGGMTTGGYGSMELNADVLKNVTATGDHMAAQLNDDRSNIGEVVEASTGLTLTEKEVQVIQAADNASLAINTVISERASVGWTSTNHTGADIPLYVYGPQSDKFAGFHDNTDLPKMIAETMKLK
ncbi:alkaline phosphatase [Virgibacillus profundi]|uniref:Alkaline phosphatase n=1 Tax=Virgibacillus profundi TaxID=2024555 RepID=A0A2A2IHD2_9BACI|nr:alkaline phosphatase [Virgibacillus profundi]PAV30788.1 alkaline phosphatase [Virgibacillus profundi]PXY54971.1 alkaline phosphatase [Virgibacillus profundi]